MIPEWVLLEPLKEAAKAAAKRAVELFHRSRADSDLKLTISVADPERMLGVHLTFVENWSAQISMRDLPRSRDLGAVFVPLEISEGPTSRAQFVGPEHLLSTRLNAVLLGHPGAGKTTTIKFLCQQLLHQPGETNQTCNFPLLVRLRDLRPPRTLVDQVLEISGIQVSRQGDKPPDKEREAEHARQLALIKQQTAVEYLEQSGALLLLDGLDEMHPDLRADVEGEIRMFANLLSNSRFVLSCRIGATSSVFDNSEQLYIRPLNAAQILSFTDKWFASNNLAAAFRAAAHRSPFADTLGRPLVLASLCILYQTYGELPEPPTLMYQKIVQLYLEEWDRQRDIKRVSAYGRFGPERKRQFLAALAYQLGQRSTYSTIDLEVAYRVIHARFGLPFEQRNTVLAEIESHTDLLVQNGFGGCEFTHKSIQEFLCADHISRIPSVDDEADALLRLPNECAIACALSASPGQFVLRLFLGGNGNDAYQDSPLRWIAEYWNPFLTRLFVERVGFDLSIETGLMLLLLSSISTSDDSADRPEVITFFDLLDQLDKVPNVHGSIVEVAQMFSLDSSDRGSVNLRVKSMKPKQLPAGLPDRLVLSRRYLENVIGQFEFWGHG